MNLRSPLEVTVAVLVILVGILIGGMFAIFTRPSNQQTAQTVTATSTNASPRSSRTPRPSAPATVTPTLAATPTAVATVAPTPPPTPQPTAPSTAAPASAPAAAATAAAARPQPGLWRISEANLQVGTIVWSGSGVASGGSIVFDVHKESVAGHGVSPCEHQTTLHAVLAAGSAPQTVPYREVNCSGATSTGEMRVSGFSGDGRTFSGSFWSGGSKLGDFTASR